MLLESKKHGTKVHVTNVVEREPDPEDEYDSGTPAVVSVTIKAPFADGASVTARLSPSQVDDLITLLEYQKLAAQNKL